MTKPTLTVELLRKSAAEYSQVVTNTRYAELYGVTDGKAVGTQLEHGFRDFLTARFGFESGNSAEGIDFPSLNVDLKVTSIVQPQSSCPFKSAREKVYGLGYSLIVFVYEKSDEADSKSATLRMLHTIFVHGSRTADYPTTNGLIRLLDNNGNQEDIESFLQERNLPLDEVGIRGLAGEILRNRPMLGFLTISNALQWRLQYKRVIEEAGKVDGIIRIR